MPTLKRNRIAGVLTSALLLVGGALIALHPLRADVNPLVRTISQYLVGDYSLIARLALFAAAGIGLALAVVLRDSLARSRQARWSRALLVVTAVTLTITAIIPPDVPTFDMPLSPGGFVHRISAFVAFATLNAAVVMLTICIQRDTRWPPIARWLGVSALAAIGALVFCALVWAAHWPLFGLGERLLAFTDWVWMLVVAWHLPVATAWAVEEKRT